MASHGKKVLLVDDDADFRRATRKTLESGGYEVIEAASGSEGFDRAAADRPDLILVDIVMEKFSDGFALIAQLAQQTQTRTIPRVILSSLGIEQHLDRVYPEELGVRHVLQKPVKMEELLSTVASVLESKAE